MHKRDIRLYSAPSAYYPHASNSRINERCRASRFLQHFGKNHLLSGGSSESQIIFIPDSLRPHLGSLCLRGWYTVANDDDDDDGEEDKDEGKLISHPLSHLYHKTPGRMDPPGA